MQTAVGITPLKKTTESKAGLRGQLFGIEVSQGPSTWLALAVQRGHPRLSARCCSHLLYLFHREDFVYYPSTHSPTFERFANCPPCQNLGLVASLLRLFLRLFGWCPVFGGLWVYFGVGLGLVFFLKA